MQLSPRYDGPAILAMEGSVTDPGLAVTRQRRRLERMLAELSPAEWAASSRCDAWSVRDVVAHLVTVNQFWETSVRGGRDHNPTRILAQFDPVAHPRMLVDSLAELTADDVLAEFVASNDGFLGVVAELGEDEWALVAESPIGHANLARIIDHALWDSWVHERDIALPLGRRVDDEPDELAASLRYAAALGPALATALPDRLTGSVAVAATEPDDRFVIDVGPTIVVRDEPGDESLPCLRGRSADLIEALSLRGPLPADAPDEWRTMMQGLAAAFDAT